MRSDVSIHFENEQAKYAAGDIIKGHVEIVLTSDIKVKEIVANFYGIARVSWSEQRAYTKGSSPTVSHKNTEVYLDENAVLLSKATAKEPLTRLDSDRTIKGGSRSSSRNSTLQHAMSLSGTADDEGVVISAGSHTFPFELTLPRDLPATFDGHYGQVKYGVKVMLVRPWKFDITREKEFEVTGFMDMNEEPDLARPIGGLEEFRIGFLCFDAGWVTAELRVARRGFTPGEQIPVSAEIENLTRRTMYDVKIALVQTVTYRIGKKCKRTTTTLSSVSKGKVQAGGTYKLHNESLSIPKSAPPSSSKSCKVLSIRYVVQLVINHSSWLDNLVLSVTVTMGTIPLRPHTINTYLQLLGILPTPLSSPTARTKRSSICSTGNQRQTAGSIRASSSQDSARRSQKTKKDPEMKDGLADIAETSDSITTSCSVEVYKEDIK